MLRLVMAAPSLVQGLLPPSAALWQAEPFSVFMSLVQSLGLTPALFIVAGWAVYTERVVPGKRLTDAEARHQAELEALRAAHKEALDDVRSQRDKAMAVAFKVTRVLPAATEPTEARG